MTLLPLNVAGNSLLLDFGIAFKLFEIGEDLDDKEMFVPELHLFLLLSLDRLHPAKSLEHFNRSIELV